MQRVRHASCVGHGFSGALDYQAISGHGVVSQIRGRLVLPWRSLQQRDSTCAFSESFVTWAWRGWYPSHRLRERRWLLRHNAAIQCMHLDFTNQISPVFPQLVGFHHNPHPCNHPPSRTHKQSSLSNDSWTKNTHPLSAKCNDNPCCIH